MQQLLDYDIIELSRSPYVFPAVFVPKKSGGLRMTVDYRSLNKVTISPATVLPHMDQVKEKLAGHSVFSVLDLNSGFFQIPLNEMDREKTAFCPGPGFPIYQFKVMPQGISGGPSACVELMNRVYDNLNFAFNFMDDSLIMSNSRQQHLLHLRECFERIRAAGLTLNGAKCQIAKCEIQFLGTVFSEVGASPSPTKVAAIQSIESLKNVKEVRQFLGLASQYRKYINRFAEIAEPLNRLLDKGTDFVWDVRCGQALDELKSKLSSAPVLANPDIRKTFEVYSDASDAAVAAVLQQEGRPIEYASRALTGAERKYSVSEKECLAILYALKSFRHYLLGKHFTIFTDHCPLTFLQSQKNDSHGRLGRWSLILQNYDFTIKYIKG
ncbi:MAG: reverse transcriptase family protein, partial [Pseudomonadota bacterium]